MARLICVMGESGSGKTTAMRTLDPKTTFYIDCDKKGLSWRGWRSQYGKEKRNYFSDSDPEKIIKMLEAVNGLPELSHIQTVVIDTINGIMVDKEMRDAKETGYGKWIDLAQDIYLLVSDTASFRKDLTVIFIAHSQTERDENGYLFTRVKTNGRKLEKICLESKFTTVLLAKCAGGRHIFETHAKSSTAKSPMGLFKEDEIENDMQAVLTALDEYEQEEAV